MDPDQSRKLVAEAIGAFTLIFIGWGASLYSGSLLGVAFAHGLAIAIMVCALGHISGGHFNPAVTAGFWVTGRMKLNEVVAYWVAQIAGGIVAALLIKSVRNQIHPGLGPNAGLTQLTPGLSAWRGLMIEFVLTFFLVLVVFGVAVDRRGTYAAVAGLPIGLMITIDILMGGPLTGASMNPARTIGPDVAMLRFQDIWIYIIACPLGGAAAALLYDRFLGLDQAATAPA